MLANIPKGTKCFLTWLLHVSSNHAGYLLEKIFPEEFPCNHKIVEPDWLRWRMNQFADLEPLSLHFLIQNIFPFQLVEIIDGHQSVSNFKFERICWNISISKKLGRGTLSTVRTSKTKMSQTEEIKIFSTKNECNVVNFGVVTKFRYSIAKFFLVWFNQLTGLHPPLKSLYFFINNLMEDN